MTTFNDVRVRKANDAPVDPAGRYVLYWAQMARRLRANHALDYAAHWAGKLSKPLVVYEGLRLDYPWASARFHLFMLQGMRDNAADAKAFGVTYWPFVETPDAPARGLVRKLCERACLLVTDDYPQFIVPAQTRSAAARVNVAVHAVDNNAVVPLARLGPAVSAANHLRPRIHKLFADAWAAKAAAEPDVPKAARGTVDPPFDLWRPPADLGKFVKGLPVDQTVPAVPNEQGGAAAGHAVLARFVADKLPRYADHRNTPDDPAANAASGLSWYLHYGHLGIQEVCAAVLGEGWTPALINAKTRNKDDFFCRDANVNGFLDEAVTWRDVGYHWHYRRMEGVTADGRGKSWQDPGDTWPAFNFASFDFAPPGKSGTLDLVLPEWAKATLAAHRRDRREHLYDLERFENADTHDELWNAAQRQLVATGRIHNYLRMLWGKKVLEWSESPEDGYRVLEHLNNKYAIDGRDPNSYTGVLWCFGLFDRPWPPERPVFGTVRYMTSASTAKKFKLADYYAYVRRLPTVQRVRAGDTAAAAADRLF